MEYIKCEKCGKGDHYGGIYTTHLVLHRICLECWREWVSDGYFDIWFTLNDELRDKFILDFLGKLGK